MPTPQVTGLVRLVRPVKPKIMHMRLVVALAALAGNVAGLGRHGGGAGAGVGGPPPPACSGRTEPGVRLHVPTDGLVPATTSTAAGCCALCSGHRTPPACRTWSFGWTTTSNTGQGHGCHLSPHPPLNQTADPGYTGGTIKPGPPSPAPPPRPPPPLPPPGPPTPPAAGRRPPRLVLLADDLGYGYEGYTRAQANASAPEISTPHMDALVANGIALDRHCERNRLPSAGGIHRGAVHTRLGGGGPKRGRVPGSIAAPWRSCCADRRVAPCPMP